MEMRQRPRSPWAKVRRDPTFPGVARKPGLDGLRALAVIAVIVYHLDPSWLPGGFFGVDVFFVVSGYLITSLLVSEFHRLGRIDLRRFWLARARRLLPSVAVMFAVIILASCLFARDALPALRTDVAFSLLYVVNWWLIFHKVSYFQSIGRPPLLLHMWSLAVEEQFYLLWPPALAFLLRKVNLRAILILTVVGAVASSVWMGVLFHPGLDPSRAYFGTDTHAEGLLIGCSLAIVVPPWATRRAITRRARRVLNITTVAALGGLVTMLVTFGQYSPFDYPLGFDLVDLCAAALIVMAVHPGTRFGRLVSIRPIRWVGTRSYALYLWHWPIIELTRPRQDLSLTGWPVLVLRIGLMLVTAELSYRLVEVPFKRPELWARWKAWLIYGEGGRVWIGQVWAGLSTAAVASVAALLVLVPGNADPIASLAVGSTPAAQSPLAPVHTHSAPVTAPSTPALATGSVGPARTVPSGGATTLPPLVATPMASTGTAPASGSTTTTPGAGATPTTAPPPVSATTAPPATVAPTTVSPTTAPPATAPPTATPPTTVAPSTTTVAPTTPAEILASKEPILAVGDSVLVAADQGLTAAFGTNITIDATVGRQVDDGIARLQQYQSTGQLTKYKTVVIELGTNGPMTTAQFDEIAATLSGVANVVFYNTYDPQPWEATTNATLAAQIPLHPGWTEIDWAAVATGPGILYPDEIHPTPTAGGAEFASLLTAALS
jgi:peptidoglycan/LPS O-acetylase OafA/YrhL